MAHTPTHTKTHTGTHFLTQYFLPAPHLLETYLIYMLMEEAAANFCVHKSSSYFQFNKSHCELADIKLKLFWKNTSMQSWALSVFFNFFNNKKWFFFIFYTVDNLFLHRSYLKSPLPVKLTWSKVQKIIFTPEVLWSLKRVLGKSLDKESSNGRNSMSLV